MNPRRVLRLMWNDIKAGSGRFFIVFAIIMPVVMSLLVQLAFGSIFSEASRLGIVDEGNSLLADRLAERDFATMSSYESAVDLRAAIENGAVDIGLVVPAGFDEAIAAGENPNIDLLVWGQSLASDRIVIGSALSSLIVELAGEQLPYEINAINLGDSDTLPLEDRILPLIVLMAVVIGGVMVPAASLVGEKQKRTIRALIVSPMSLGEIYLAKGLLGAILGWFVGMATLVLNQAFIGDIGVIAVVLFLGATLSAAFGLMLGTLVKDINTLFATIKSIGILLYAPGFVALFPGIPQWIAQVFPTYYIIGPVMDITQQGASATDVMPDIAILVVLVVAMVGGVAFLLGRVQQREAYGM